MKDLIIRTLTGIIFVVTLISGICIHSTTFLILFCIITGLTVWEFSGLVNHYEKAHVRRILNVIGGMYLFAATFAYAHGFANEKIFLPYLLFLILIMVAELYYKAPNPIDNWAFSLFAQLYCAAPFALLNFIGIAPDGSGAYTPMFILALFVFVWMDDSGGLPARDVVRETSVVRTHLTQKVVGRILGRDWCLRCSRRWHLLGLCPKSAI